MRTSAWRHTWRAVPGSTHLAELPPSLVHLPHLHLKVLERPCVQGSLVPCLHLSGAWYSEMRPHLGTFSSDPVERSRDWSRQVMPVPRSAEVKGDVAGEPHPITLFRTGGAGSVQRRGSGEAAGVLQGPPPNPTHLLRGLHTPYTRHPTVFPHPCLGSTLQRGSQSHMSWESGAGEKEYKANCVPVSFYLFCFFFFLSFFF